MHKAHTQCPFPKVWIPRNGEILEPITFYKGITLGKSLTSLILSFLPSKSQDPLSVGLSMLVNMEYEVCTGHLPSTQEHVPLGIMVLCLHPEEAILSPWLSQHWLNLGFLPRNPLEQQTSLLLCALSLCHPPRALPTTPACSPHLTERVINNVNSNLIC